MLSPRVATDRRKIMNIRRMRNTKTETLALEAIAKGKKVLA